LRGALIEETYPSTRKVRNTLDARGGLAEVESRKNSASAYWSYANSFTYNAAGAVTAMRLGNGLWESTAFNARLQPTQIALGNMPGTTNLLKLDYDYGLWNGSTFDQTKNNGNIGQQTITAPTVGASSGFTATQIYTYDALNRLGQATEYSTVNWQQTFGYDRYGNRNFAEAGTTTIPKNCLDGSTPVVCSADRKKYNPSINASDNRFASGQDYSYDLAGNTTADANSQSYIYDGRKQNGTGRQHRWHSRDLLLRWRRQACQEGCARWGNNCFRL
jgi:hypothetical protein